MRKLIIVLGVVIALVVGSMAVMRAYTKSHSPADIAEYKSESISLEVNYCRPYKKNRTVFGELVPYNEVWRTGANEATTFTTQHDVYVQGKLLPAGTYTLWTKPGENEWKVYFNKEYGQWGVTLIEGKANHDEAQDELVITVPSYPPKKTIEQFTIQFEQMDGEIDMIMMWDNTLVVVPFEAAIP